MIPKKTEVIIREVAEQHDLPISMVDDIVSFYYKEVRKKLSSLEDIRLNIPGLGHFVIKKVSVDKLVKKYENMVKNYDSQTFSNYHNKKLAQAKLEKLYNARKKIDQFLTYKKIFKDGRKNNGSVEE
jgi:hypothetical protein